MVHQQTIPPLYRAYTDLYSGTDPTERFPLIQTLARLYIHTDPVILCDSPVYLILYDAVQPFMQLKASLHRIEKHAQDAVQSFTRLEISLHRLGNMRSISHHVTNKVNAIKKLIEHNIEIFLSGNRHIVAIKRCAA